MTSKEILLAQPEVQKCIAEYREHLMSYYMGLYEKFRKVILEGHEEIASALDQKFNKDGFIRYVYAGDPMQIAKAAQSLARHVARKLWKLHLGFIENARSYDQHRHNRLVTGSVAFSMTSTFEKGERHTKAKVNQIVDRDCEFASDKLVSTITKKTGEIREITINSFAFSGGAWVGRFIINNQHTISVKMILAGGYNIQCLHTRYLCNIIKPKK